MKLVGALPDTKVKPTTYEAALANDLATFDSVPGAGFNTDPASAAILPPQGRAQGSGPVLLVDPAQNNAFRALNRAWQQGGTVARSGNRYAISGLAGDAQDALVAAFALQAERAPATNGSAPMKKPRLGIFQPWSGSMDEGWTRWVLEQYGFSFSAHPSKDFRPLAEKIDVLILADDARVPVAGAAGGRGGRGAVRSEYSYQLAADDVQRLDQFVRGGGTLVCLSNASTFAIQQLKLPIKNVVAGLRPEEFFLRGSIVEVDVDVTHPVMAGMPEKAALFVDSSPVFEPEEGFTGTVLARYQESGSPLRSGYLIGEKYLNGRAAALDARVGDGHVVLLGFRPQWRGQPFGTFRVLFNAALFGSR